MTQDVPQWLTEIQSLQQRLAHVSQERAAAYEQLDRWQQSYQTEAQQRRKDIRRLQTVIYRLDQENKRLKQQLRLPPDARSPFFMDNQGDHESRDDNGEVLSPLSDSKRSKSSQAESIQPVAEQPVSPPSLEKPAEGIPNEQALMTPDPQPLCLQQNTLQQKLQDALSKCDRLSQSLSQEQADHEQTRQTLMTALGDTVDQLERERKRHALLQKTLQQTSQQKLSQQQVPKNTTDGVAAIAPHSSDANPPLPGRSQKQLAPAPPKSPESTS